jgi:hypothetical protein
MDTIGLTRKGNDARFQNDEIHVTFEAQLCTALISACKHPQRPIDYCSIHFQIISSEKINITGTNFDMHIINKLY